MYRWSFVYLTNISNVITNLYKYKYIVIEYSLIYDKIDVYVSNISSF